MVFCEFSTQGKSAACATEQRLSERRAEKAGTGYQTMMNEALRNCLAETGQPVTERGLRQILRQEMPEYLKGLAAGTPTAARKRKLRRTA